MKLRRIRLRITLLNLMLATAVFSITLAICRPRTELWPTYLAVTWVTSHSSVHEPFMHDLIAQEFTSPAVIRDVLADPVVAGLPRIKAASDPRQELLSGIVIEVHPSNQGYIQPTVELIRVVVQSSTPSESMVVRDALLVAYLRHRKLGGSVRGTPAPPERIPHPLFDRPWKFFAATALGVFSSTLVLIIPIGRSKRFQRAVMAVLAVGLSFGAALWWLMTHPEFYFSIGGLRFL
jgi:hypothetical protein